MYRVALLALLLAAPAAAANGDVFGRWVVEDGRAVIEIEPCGAQACGHLVWMREPRDEAGNPKRDDRNPDPAARDRLLCGLRLIDGLKPAGDGSWKGGRIYSARDGKTYGFEIAPDGEDRLAARGFMGISLLGSTRTWVRAGSRYGSCTTMEGTASDR